MGGLSIPLQGKRPASHGVARITSGTSIDPHCGLAGDLMCGSGWPVPVGAAIVQCTPIAEQKVVRSEEGVVA